MSVVPFRHFACNSHARNYECFNAGCHYFCACAWCCSDIRLSSTLSSTWYFQPGSTMSIQYGAATSRQSAGQQPLQFTMQLVSQSIQPPPTGTITDITAHWEENLRRRAAEAEFKRQEEVKNAEHERKLAEIAAATRALREGERDSARSASPRHAREQREVRARDPLLYYPEDHKNDSDEEFNHDQRDGVRPRDPLLYYPSKDQDDQGYATESETGGESKHVDGLQSASPPKCEATKKTKRKRAAVEEGGQKSVRVMEHRAKKVKREVDDSDGEIVVAVKAEDDPFA